MDRIVRKWSPHMKEESKKISTKLYMEIYTEADLAALVAMFGTKTGQKFLGNQQYLTTEIIRQIIPKTAGMSEELKVEIPKALENAGFN